MHICLTIIHSTDNSNVHWTYAYSIGSNGQLLRPLDISMCIRSNGQLKCPLDICMSNGSIGSNGPLDILTLPSHRPATCMGSMPTYDVIRVNLFTALPNVQWTCACPLDPMDRIKCPVDIFMSIGSNGQLKCPLDICMSNGSIGSNGPLDILPLPSHRPATCMGSMSTDDAIQVNLFAVQSNVQWTYSCPLDPMDKSNVQWTCACPLDPMDN